MNFTANAAYVLKKRYLLRDGNGVVCETPDQLWRRVAKAVSSSERTAGDRDRYEGEFYGLLSSLDFLPNSPTLMNAGTGVGQLSACFVLPVGDSLPEIMRAVSDMAVIHKSGGGTGFSFSSLRSRGSIVGSTGGEASGPLSFMRIFDVTADVVKQGGRRRGANMAILRCDHPDVRDFITAKDSPGAFANFNLSVAATDDFMARSERHQAEREIVRLAASHAWQTGEPGLVFIDTINKHNTTPQLGSFEATNPCGEQPLLPYESCNLGSINLRHMIVDGKPSAERLVATAKIATRFLNDVIDANAWPLPEVEVASLATRKIGLGVMGFADMLIEMGVPYASEDALRLASEIALIVQTASHEASAELAADRGVFPAYTGSLWDKAGCPMLNATTTTIAPTGSISIIAGCSSGIEPLYAVSFERNILDGSRLIETSPLFERIARDRGFWSDDLANEIANAGGVGDIHAIPADVRKLFATALEIPPKWHVQIQAAFQAHVDNAVSKTINLPGDATIGDVETAYRLAWKLGCKGLTVYRDGSRREQVLSRTKDGRTPSAREAD